MTTKRSLPRTETGRLGLLGQGRLDGGYAFGLQIVRGDRWHDRIFVLA